MSRTRLTLEEHAEIGAALSAAYEAVVIRSTRVANAYARRTPQVRELEKAYRALVVARSALDSALFDEFPDDASPAVYYPQGRPSRF